MKKFLFCLIFIFVGFLLSFFLILVSLFSDSPGFNNERVFTLLITAAVYFFAGIFFKYFHTENTTLYIRCFLAPLVLPLAYGFKEFNIMLYSVIYIGVAVGFILLGRRLNLKKLDV